jgi:hypothetical protein
MDYPLHHHQATYFYVILRITHAPSSSTLSSSHPPSHSPVEGINPNYPSSSPYYSTLIPSSSTTISHLTNHQSNPVMPSILIYLEIPPP